jgi:hypothetical protein
MADDIKNRENKDAEESGRPVQLDREEQGNKKAGQQDKQHDKQAEPGQQPGQPQQR